MWDYHGVSMCLFASILYYCLNTSNWHFVFWVLSSMKVFWHCRFFSAVFSDSFEGKLFSGCWAWTCMNMHFCSRLNIDYEMSLQFFADTEVFVTSHRVPASAPAPSPCCPSGIAERCTLRSWRPGAASSETQGLFILRIWGLLHVSSIWSICL